MENKNLIEFITDFFNFKGLAKGVKKSSEIIKIELKISKLNKEKTQKLKELGLLVYEFYHLDKNLKNDDEIQDLISEIKDIDTEITELEKRIEEIKNSENIVDKNEIENELLNKNTPTETEKDKNNEIEDKSNGKNKTGNGTNKES